MEKASSGTARDNAGKRDETGKAAKKTVRSYLPAEERRASILQAAREIFSRSSFEGARTRDIADAAGVNPATLYWHFQSKEEIFAEAVVQPLVDAMGGMLDRVAGFENAATEEELAAAARTSILHHLRSMVDIYPLLTTALFSNLEMGKKLYREHLAPLFRERGEAMKNVLGDRIDAEKFALLTFGMFFAVAMERYFTDQNEDLAEMAEEIMNLSTFGIAGDRFHADGSDKRAKN